MKKYLWKIGLVLVLAVALVFCLAACGDKDDNSGNNGGGDNNPPTSQWSASDELAQKGGTPPKIAAYHEGKSDGDDLRAGFGVGVASAEVDTYVSSLAEKGYQTAEVKNNNISTVFAGNNEITVLVYTLGENATADEKAEMNALIAGYGISASSVPAGFNMFVVIISKPLNLWSTIDYVAAKAGLPPKIKLYREAKIDGIEMRLGVANGVTWSSDVAEYISWLENAGFEVYSQKDSEYGEIEAEKRVNSKQVLRINAVLIDSFTEYMVDWIEQHMLSDFLVERAELPASWNFVIVADLVNKKESSPLWPSDNEIERYIPEPAKIQRFLYGEDSTSKYTSFALSSNVSSAEFSDYNNAFLANEYYTALNEGEGMKVISATKMIPGLGDNGITINVSAILFVDASEAERHAYMDAIFGEEYDDYPADCNMIVCIEAIPREVTPPEPPFVEDMWEILSSIGKGETPVSMQKLISFSADFNFDIRIGDLEMPFLISAALLVDPVNVPSDPSDTSATNKSAVYLDMDLNGFKIQLYFSLADCTTIYIKSESLGSDEWHKFETMQLVETAAEQNSLMTHAVFNELLGYDKIASGWSYLELLFTGDSNGFGGKDYDAAKVIGNIIERFLIDREVPLYNLLNELGLGDDFAESLGFNSDGTIDLLKVTSVAAGVLSWQLTKTENGNLTDAEFDLISSGGVGGIVWGIIEGLLNSKDFANGMFYNSISSNFVNKLSFHYSYDTETEMLESFGLSFHPNYTLDIFEVSLNVANIAIKNISSESQFAYALSAAEKAAAKRLAFESALGVSMTDDFFKLSFDPKEDGGKTWEGGAEWKKFWQLQGEDAGGLSDALATAVTQMVLAGDTTPLLITFNVDELSLKENVTQGTLTILFIDNTTLSIKIVSGEGLSQIALEVDAKLLAAADKKDAQAYIGAKYLINALGMMLISESDSILANASVGGAISQVDIDAAKAYIALVSAKVSAIGVEMLEGIEADGEVSISLNPHIWAIFEEKCGDDIDHWGGEMIEEGDVIGLLRAMLMSYSAETDEYYVFFVDSKGDLMTTINVSTIVTGGVAKIQSGMQLEFADSLMYVLDAFATSAAPYGYVFIGWEGLDKIYVEDKNGSVLSVKYVVEEIYKNTVVRPIYQYSDMPNYVDTDTEWYGFNLALFIQTIAEMSQADGASFGSVSNGVSGLSLSITNIDEFISNFYGKFAAKHNYKSDEYEIESFVPLSSMSAQARANAMKYLCLDPVTEAFVAGVLAGSKLTAIEDILQGGIDLQVETGNLGLKVVVTYIHETDFIEFEYMFKLV